jgi:diaminopimelate epimerase
MSDVNKIDREDNFWFLDTGSPHYVEFVDRVAEIDVVGEGRKTRYSERFMPGGTNVNFVEMDDDRIFVRTYERGVEDETLSCGTGVTASAIVAYFINGKTSQMVHTTGGDFVVSFDPEAGGTFTNVWLRGPAEAVFEGTIELLPS